MTELRPTSPEEYARSSLGGLVHYLLNIGVSMHDAEDIAGDTMVRLCEQWSSITNPCSWARVAAQRLAIDRFRAGRAEEARTQRDAMLAPSVMVSSEDLWMLKEEQRAVIVRIRQLPPMQRTVLALHLDGVRNSEIAGILAVPASTVASNLRHAKRSLAKMLQAEGVYHPVGLGTEEEGDAL